MVKVQIKTLETEQLIFKKGWSRKQLSEAANLSMVSLCPILNGKPCGIRAALKIAKALDADINEIAITYPGTNNTPGTTAAPSAPDLPAADHREADPHRTAGR